MLLASRGWGQRRCSAPQRPVTAVPQGTRGQCMRGGLYLGPPARRDGSPCDLARWWTPRSPSLPPAESAPGRARCTAGAPWAVGHAVPAQTCGRPPLPRSRGGGPRGRGCARGFPAACAPPAGVAVPAAFGRLHGRLQGSEGRACFRSGRRTGHKPEGLGLWVQTRTPSHRGHWAGHSVGPSWALEGAEQHLWSPLTRCQEHPV